MLNSKGSGWMGWVIGIFFLNLASRLVFLSWYPAQYTDSILYMSALDQLRGTIILPAYPFAIVMLRRIFNDPVVAGRVVSILAASLAVFPLYGLARIVSEKRAALFTILLYTVSPLIFRWSLRIFPHALYSLFLLLSLYGIFKFIETKKVIGLAGGILAAGLAALTYPTGLVLAPVAVGAFLFFLVREMSRNRRRLLWLILWLGGAVLLSAGFFRWQPWRGKVEFYFSQVLSFFPVNFPGPVVVWHLSFMILGEAIILLIGFYLLAGSVREKGWWYKRPANIILLVISWGGYVFLYIWQKYLARSDWYQQGMRTSMRSVAARWELWLKYYLYSFPYILVYPVAVAAVIGLVFIAWSGRRKKIRWLWPAFYIYFFVGVTYALVVNKWWTPRYQYCLVPFALVFAGAGISWVFNWRRFKWPAVIFASICLGASIVFTSFVLYWSRDSFGDMRRAAHYAKEHAASRRIFSTELVKSVFWSKVPMVGYTWRNRFSIRVGDLLILTGWHVNLRKYFRDLNRRFETRVLRKEKSVIKPLLADDVVSWARNNLPRRANDPVLWRERFNKQVIESWVVEIKEKREGKDGIPELDREIPPAAPQTEHATYFDKGVWEVKNTIKAGEKVRLELAHARSGSAGSFSFVVYGDQNGDGLPDKLIARSPELTGSAGKWSKWEFISPGGKLFVGSAWKLGNWVYYLKPPWPGTQLGDTMYYSRGGVPRSRASRITKLKIMIGKNYH